MASRGALSVFSRHRLPTVGLARATAEAPFVEILLPPVAHERPATKVVAAVNRRRSLRGELAEPRP
jgi:hypothetical protein